MIVEACVGGLILLILILIVLFIIRNRPFSARKSKGDHLDTLTITANRNIHKITVKSNDIIFARSKIRKGQTVDFTYPAAETKTIVIVETEQGKQRTYEM
ncbi:hypothetical protein JXA56_02070 [Candidatus Micrarchaeota archaeon]|nr:hypothetical protein [Candidatus Micrarchaeota archaeon]